MMEKMNATPIEIGLPLFAIGFGYLLGITLFSNYGHHFERFSSLKLISTISLFFPKNRNLLKTHSVQ